MGFWSERHGGSHSPTLVWFGLLKQIEGIKRRLSAESVEIFDDQQIALRNPPGSDIIKEPSQRTHGPIFYPGRR
jgi:hypothetical protein